MATTSECVDRINTPLNACSLEILGSSLVVGCYQLHETSTSTSSTDDVSACSNEGEHQRQEESSDQSPSSLSSTDATTGGAATPTRSGELRLYNVSSSPGNQSQPSFGEPAQIVPMESGVLDAKWHTTTCRSNDSRNDGNDQQLNVLGSACASGRIHIHQLISGNVNDTSSATASNSLTHVASSDIDESASDSGATPMRLALSLDWDRSKQLYDADANSSLQRTRIISSYSDGSLSIHSFCPNDGNTADTDTNNAVQSLVEEERWNTHSMFGCPSEVWTCCFAANAESSTNANGANAVLSGGDDCTMKLWDVRCLASPMAKVGANEFDAGVTAVSYHPKLEHVFAVGSYDEVVRLYDARMLGNGADPLCRTRVGGGVWRIRWHPEDENRILVGAMHGGCRIVNFGALSSENDVPAESCAPAISSEIEYEFTEHESMAYGADWLVPQQHEGYAEYAASCSFYDRRVCLWRSTAQSK